MKIRNWKYKYKEKDRMYSIYQNESDDTSGDKSICGIWGGASERRRLHASLISKAPKMAKLIKKHLGDNKEAKALIEEFLPYL